MTNHTAVQQKRSIRRLPLGKKGLEALMHGTLPPTRGDSGQKRWVALTESDGVLGEIEGDDSREARTLAEALWPDCGDELHLLNRAAVESIRASKVRLFQRIRRSMAYHEAGHAVMAWHLGIPIRRITIGVTMYCSADRFDLGANSFGSTDTGNLHRLINNTTYPQIEKRIVRMMAAGPMAEYRFRGRSDWMVLNRRRLKCSDASHARYSALVAAYEHCDCQDRRSRGEETSNRHAKCIDRYIKQAGQEAGQLLDAYWHQVVSVASELERRRDIRGADLNRLIAGVPSIGLLGRLN